MGQTVGPLPTTGDFGFKILGKFYSLLNINCDLFFSNTQAKSTLTARTLKSSLPKT